MSVKAIESRRHYNYRRREEALLYIMNTRIQELADQAKSQVPKGILAPDLWIEQYNQKFAELIVAECLEIVEDEDDGSLETRPIRWAMHRIRKHFGVE